MFSPPLTPAPEAAIHAWLPSPVWLGVTGDNARGRRVGFPWWRTMLAICACVLAVWVAGMMTSFFANRALIQEIGIQATRGARYPPAAFRTTGRTALPYRANSSVCSTVFATVRRGISVSVLNVTRTCSAPPFLVMPQAANRLVRDVAAAYLQQQLNAFIALPPNSPQRTATGRTAL
ncbi:ImcF domain-containing protein [Klebsiella pneumoniae]|uniref:ImcF domain-containing protein n=1 Tax=Klebsiella pneumoniae TaxID=573 RepID=A0A377V8N8_KLEPN|nr:ImcF domain-containing protein [Klebsiella pneumoniae]